MTLDDKPFYYTSQKPLGFEPAFGCYYAPSGWYQWTKSGLKYLGESIFESAEL